MIGVTLLANFAGASNPVWAFLPNQWRDFRGGADAVDRLDNDPSNFQLRRHMRKRTIAIGAVLIAQVLGASAAFRRPLGRRHGRL
jgi:hypothetical protein